MSNSAPSSKHELVLPNGLPSPDGSLRLGACVWLYKKSGKNVSILVQKRAAGIHNGGFYDVSAGGHADGEETPPVAAVREAREEIGVNLGLDDLEFLCAYRAADKIVYIYLADWTGKSDDFTLDPGEVELVKWLPLADFASFWQTDVKPSLREDAFHLALLKDRLGNL